MMNTPSEFRLQMEEKARREAWNVFSRTKKEGRSHFVAFSRAMDKYQAEMEKA